MAVLFFRSNTRTVTWALLLAGPALFIVQLTIWNQLNNCLPPMEQLGWQVLKNPYIWFQEGGLLARHRSFYPRSQLVKVFRTLWGIFWVLVALSVAAR